MRILAVCLYFITLAGFAQTETIKLSSVRFDVPTRITKGNKTTIAKSGFSTYAFNRLANDSTSYIYNYSYREGNAIFEFRETTKADIWEWLENTYKPKRFVKSEFKHYKVEAFKNIDNDALFEKLQQFQIEYIDGRRKLTLIYKLDQTTQFMASVKSADSPEYFMSAQDSLLKVLQTVSVKEKKLRPHPKFEQTPIFKDSVENHIVRLNFPLSNDFDNPVVAVSPTDELLVVFSHADGSELLFLDKEFKLIRHQHNSRIVHDAAYVNDGFFMAVSDDYNLMRTNIYPSLYLVKHDLNGDEIFIQSFFKKDRTRIPGSKVYDYYSRNSVSLCIQDSLGLIYTTSEERTGLAQVVQKGAFKTFDIEKGFIKKGKEDLWHVSHCFGVETVGYKDDVYLFALGDYDPRGLALSKLNLPVKVSDDSTSFFHTNLLPFTGIEGDNYIDDTHLSQPVVWKDALYIAIETEHEAKTNHDDNPYSVNRGMNDIFIVKADLNGENIEVKQITKTKSIEEVNPKLAVVGDKLLLIYNEAQYNNTGLISGMSDKMVYLNDRLARESTLEDLNTYFGNEKQKFCLMADSPINRDGSELVQLSDGTTIWIRLMRNARQLEVVKIKG